MKKIKRENGMSLQRIQYILLGTLWGQGVRRDERERWRRQEKEDKHIEINRKKRKKIKKESDWNELTENTVNPARTWWGKGVRRDKRKRWRKRVER